MRKKLPSSALNRAPRVNEGCTNVGRIKICLATLESLVIYFTLILAIRALNILKYYSLLYYTS